MQDKIDEIIAAYPDIWKTRASFINFIRGGLRKGLWNRHPVKLKFLNDNRKKIPNPRPNPARGREEVWGAECALTGEVKVLSEIEVDHKTGNSKLTTLQDLESFITAIVLVTADDLQLVSKEAHKIKSHAEKMGLTFEEAKAEKEAILIGKQKKDKEWLSIRGITPESSAPKRRKQIVEAIINGS